MSDGATARPSAWLAEVWENMMIPKQFAIHRSEIDEERFGVRVARTQNLSFATLRTALNFCHENQIVLLMARCLASEIAAVHAMECAGFQLMDTLIYWRRDLTKTIVPPDSGNVTIRPVESRDIEAVQQVARASFRGYSGHYHADRRLDPERCDEAYASWAVRSCTMRTVADETLVAVANERVLGFATLRLSGEHESEGVLFCVAPEAQGLGLYRSLMVHGMEWCRNKEAASMFVSTQITNIAVQKVWARLGFEPNLAFYTFHKWFD